MTMRRPERGPRWRAAARERLASRRAADGERGSVLILALVYIIAVSMIVLALTNWATNDLNNTAEFATAQAMQNAASNTTDLAIHNIRYTPLLGANQTVGANPPSYCWGAGPISQLTTTYVSLNLSHTLIMNVWCTTVWTPSSAVSRTVTFYTCLSSVTSLACHDNPFLEAVVQYDDYPIGKAAAPIQGPCSVFCGQGMTVVSWTWGTPNNTSTSGTAASMSFSTEPSATKVGAATSAAVTVRDAANNPVVGDTVTMVQGSGPGVLSGTTVATTSTSGVATFTNLKLSAAGNYTLIAIDGTLSTTSTNVSVAKGANAITVTTSAPSGAIIGGSYSPSASATSGDVVAVTSGSTSVCTVATGVVSFKTAGTCTLNFNDPGNANYVAAAQVVQSFVITHGPSVFTVTSSAPGRATVGGATYTPTATATSGDVVVISVDAVSSAICSISAGKVSFSAAGTCTLDFNDAGNASYSAAVQVQQNVAVGPGANVITVNPAAPSTAAVGATYTPAATATSLDTVVVTLAAGSSTYCSLSGGKVTFIKATPANTYCTVNFNDPGNANYVAANQVQANIAVTASTSGSYTGSDPSGGCGGSCITGAYYAINATSPAGGSPSASTYALTVWINHNTGGGWIATPLTCTVPGGSGQTVCTSSGGTTVSVSSTDSIVIYASGNGYHWGTWVTTNTRP